LGVGLTTPSRKRKLCYENLEVASEGFKEKELIFGTWNVRTLFRNEKMEEKSKKW